MAFLVATTSLPAVYRPNGYARTMTAGTPHARAKMTSNHDHHQTQKLNVGNVSAVTGAILTKLSSSIPGTILNRYQLSGWHLSRQHMSRRYLSTSAISPLILTWFWPNFLDPSSSITLLGKKKNRTKKIQIAITCSFPLLPAPWY